MPSSLTKDNKPTLLPSDCVDRRPRVGARCSEGGPVTVCAVRASGGQKQPFGSLSAAYPSTNVRLSNQRDLTDPFLSKKKRKKSLDPRLRPGHFKQRMQGRPDPTRPDSPDKPDHEAVPPRVDSHKHGNPESLLAPSLSPVVFSFNSVKC